MTIQVNMDVYEAGKKVDSSNAIEDLTRKMQRHGIMSSPGARGQHKLIQRVVF